MTATTTEPAQPVNTDSLLAETIRTLTSAARLQSGPDFAEFVTLAVAGAVANVGSVEQALARRSGSWESEHVRNMLLSTVGEQVETLLEHRTEPLVVDVNIEQILSDLGYWRLYDDAEAELQRREDALGIPRIHVSYSMDPVASQVRTGVDERGVPTLSGHPDSRGYADAVAALPTATDEQQAALDAIEDARDRLYELLDADKATYAQTFATHAKAVAAQLFPHLPVQVEVHVQLNWTDATEADGFDDTVEHIRELARSRTEIPSSGIALADYPRTETIPDVETAAGRTPLARLGLAEQ